MWPRVLWLAYVLCLGSLNIIRIRSSSNLWINIGYCCAQRSKKLPPVLAVGLELVFGPPNPIKGELTVGQADTSNGEMSSLQFSFISFCPNVDVSVTSRSVSWWLWLSHLKDYRVSKKIKIINIIKSWFTPTGIHVVCIMALPSITKIYSSDECINLIHDY